MSETEPLLSYKDRDSSAVRRRTVRGFLNQSYINDEVHRRTQQRTQDNTIRSTSSERRIVLLSKTGSGKSATGNTIMGEEFFETDGSSGSVTKTCERGEVQIDGRKISVIDTPGLFDTRMSQENLKTEIEKCVNMSVPGPHVFLMVIRLAVRFTEEERNSVKWIQENFGKEAARYTIILFTHADHLSRSLEDNINRCNDLKALVNECGGRFHSFNNKNMENRSQVTELMKKIEMVVRNNNNTTEYYTNEMYREAQRKIFREQFWSAKPRIILLGESKSGKTSTRKTIVGRDERRNSPDSATQSRKVQEARVDGKMMKIIDIPGLIISSKKMKDEIKKCIKMSVPVPHVFLLVIRVEKKYKVSQKAVQWIQENFGEEAARYTIILFTHADELKKRPLDEYIRECNDLQALVNDCGGRFHSFNNNDMKNRSQVTELMKKIEKMVQQNDGWHYTCNVFLEVQRRKHRDQFWAGNPRIVLLGKSGSGKTSSVKTIVGPESLKRNSADSGTETCVAQTAHVDGKSMKIIDTPGLIDGPVKKMKGEILKCIKMSAPGPHVFLLVIRLDKRFIQEEEKTEKWFQENIGGEASRYTIILFTHADHLKGRSLEEFIRDSPDLQTFTESFGGRFHSFNNEDIRNRSQVTELLEKIEKMAEENEWSYCTSEMFKKLLKKYFQKLIIIVASLGPAGTAAVVAGGVLLGTAEIILAPALLVAGGGVAVVGAVVAGIYLYKRFKKD